MRVRAARGALVFAVAAPVVYLAQRIYEHVVLGPVPPLSVIREVHTSFYWRCAAAVWWAGLLALLAMRGSRVPSIATARGAGMVAVGLFAWVAWRWP